MQHDDYHHDLDDFPEAEFDQQTQARLDAAVDRLLKGYNWTLQPLANKYDKQKICICPRGRKILNPPIWESSIRELLYKLCHCQLSDGIADTTLKSAKSVLSESMNFWKMTAAKWQQGHFNCSIDTNDNLIF